MRCLIAVYLPSNKLIHVRFVNLRITVSAHRAEFENLEAPSTLAEAVLTEKYGAFGGQFDGRRNQRPRGEQRVLAPRGSREHRGRALVQGEFLAFFPAREFGIQRRICRVPVVVIAGLFWEKMEGDGNSCGSLFSDHFLEHTAELSRKRFWISLGAASHSWVPITPTRLFSTYQPMMSVSRVASEIPSVIF